MSGAADNRSYGDGAYNLMRFRRSEENALSLESRRLLVQVQRLAPLAYACSICA